MSKRCGERGGETSSVQGSGSYFAGSYPITVSHMSVCQSSVSFVS